LLHAARGEYVMALASDDYLLPSGPSSLIAALQASNSQAVFGDAQVIDEDGNLLYASALFEYRHANRERLTTNLAYELILNWTAGCTVTMFRREPILAMGGYDEALTMEDWDFYLRLAARGWLKFVNATASAYRLHGSNLHLDPEARRAFRLEQARIRRTAAAAFRGRTRWLLLATIAYNSPQFERLGGKRLLGPLARIVKARA
jgi:cellulose synthase/poly-beta-1,6-N-acetylglucosamine synthase-like glycosyltransferase